MHIILYACFLYLYMSTYLKVIHFAYLVSIYKYCKHIVIVS